MDNYHEYLTEPHYFKSSLGSLVTHEDLFPVNYKNQVLGDL